MTGTRTIRNLALIGFMGTGKSCVGRLTAEHLHLTYLDTDHVIEARAGKSISDIFQQDGEPAFRDWERRIVEELTHRDRTVIATGGGGCGAARIAPAGSWIAAAVSAPLAAGSKQ